MWIGVGIKIGQKIKYLLLASLAGLVIWPLIFFGTSIYSAIIAIIYSLLVYGYTRKAVQPYMLGRKALREAHRKKWLRKL
jgi:hypothetical protein